MEILKFTVAEMAVLPDLVKLAKDAIDAEQKIKDASQNAFKKGETSIEVYHTASFRGYYGTASLTIDGRWCYRDNWQGENKFEIRCNAQEIFKLYRAFLLKVKGMSEFLSDEEKRIADIAPQFQFFVAELGKEM